MSVQNRNQQSIYQHYPKNLTTLTTHSVTYVEQALAYFGYDHLPNNQSLPKGEKVVIFYVTSKLYQYCSIPSAGVYVIMSSWGVIDPKPVEPGFHFMWPWKRVEWVITKHYLPIDIPVKACPTADNVMIQVDALALIRVEEPYVFVTTIGPQKLMQVLRAFIEESVRAVARTVGYFEAYDIRGQDLHGMVRALNDKISVYGVSCSDVTIQDVFLPVELVNTLNKESSYYSLLKAQKRETDFKSLQLKNEEFRKTVQLQRSNERLALQVQTEKIISIIKKDSEEIIGITSMRLKEIESEEKAQVLNVKVKNELECAKILGKKDKDFLITVASGKKKADLTIATINAYEKVVKSDTQLNVSEIRAKSVEVKGQAEEKVQEKLKAKRKDIVNRKQISIIGTLSSNQDVTISGSSNYSEISQLVGTNDNISVSVQPK